MKKVYSGKAISMAPLIIGSAFAVGCMESASTIPLSGTIKDAQGNMMQGVLVRATNEASGVSEAVYTNVQGQYKLATKLSGDIKVRVRSPYFKDEKTSVTLAQDSAVKADFVMQAMTDNMEISDSLPAAYHFGSLPFETGADSNFNQYQFTRDCLSCHQVGNSFTRVPRSAENWAITIERMHGYVGNFDAELKERRSELLSKGFDGKPVMVRPEFPLDKELDHTKIYEYALPATYIPHDAIVHPETDLIYTVDQGTDNMIITDQNTGQSEYVQHPAVTTPIDPNNPFSALHGPHSLDLGPDGKYYTTNAFSNSIGVFDPKINKWENPIMIPSETGAVYPHTIRFDSKGIAWFTLTTSEHIGRFDPVSKKFNIIDIPKRESGGVSDSTEPYGIDINPIDDSVWYGRLFGDIVGHIDPKTLKVIEHKSPVRGPRRMHFDKKGILWVTGYSQGQLARIDVKNGFTSKVYDMPEFAEGFRPAPYALNVHPETQDIWLNENMTDRVYRFIPSEERFVVYPMPLRGTYTRDTTFNKAGHVCMSNNPLPQPALEGGVLELICIDPQYNSKS